MKRMLQLFAIAVAALLFFAGGGEPAFAQSYYYRDYGRDGNYRTYATNPGYGYRRHRVKRHVGKRRAKRRTVRRTRRKVTIKTQTRSNWTSAAARSDDPVQLVVSIPDQRVNVYRGDKKIASSRVSTGRNGYRTPSGIFSIIQKNKIHYSNLYESAPMPFMQRITWSGVALHAGNVSRPYASHGCIRLPYGFAKNLFSNTTMGAHVIVGAGASAPMPIQHETLLQPLPGLPKVETIATETSAGGFAPTAGAGDEGLLADFVKPVEQAANKLAEARQARDDAEAALAPLQQKLEAASADLAARKTAYEAARKETVSTSRAIRAPLRALRRGKQTVAALERKLAKAENRTRWAQHIVEKRHDNPKFEGNWMKMALARLADRTAVQEAAAAELEAARKDLAALRLTFDRAVNARDAAKTAEADRLTELRDGNAALRQARRDLANGKRTALTTKNEVAKARSQLQASQAREKLPLRILITPVRGVEQVKNAQRLLAELGYDVGEADGVVGRKTRAAIKAFQTAMQQPATGGISDQLIDDLYRKAGRPQTVNAHMYVRQGFLDLFDIPIEVVAPDRPLGTHLFTAMHFDEGATSAEWTALTVRERVGGRTKKSRKSRSHETSKYVNVTASEALDRIRIPSYARRQLSMMLTPGSSIVISDKGMSNETGKGTDFVVLTRKGG